MATALSPDHQVNLARAGSFRLGSAEVQPAILQIRNNGVTQLLEPRVMQMLVALYAAGGATVTKQQLIENCWGGLAVSDDAITSVCRSCGASLRMCAMYAWRRLHASVIVWSLRARWRTRPPGRNGSADEV